MIKLYILFLGVCASLSYFSFYKPKNEANMELTMAILRDIEESNLNDRLINELLEDIEVPNEVKSEVKDHIKSGLSYSKYKRINYGEYELQ